MAMPAGLRNLAIVLAIAALIASSATERMLTGVTNAALVGMWVAAGLTFYTGYAYLQAGLSHAQAGQRRRTPPVPGEDAPAARREQRPA